MGIILNTKILDDAIDKCPKCKETPLIKITLESHRVRIRCRFCGYVTRPYKDITEAIDAWNSRCREITNKAEKEQKAKEEREYWQNLLEKWEEIEPQHRCNTCRHLSTRNTGLFDSEFICKEGVIICDGIKNCPSYSLRSEDYQYIRRLAGR